VFRRVAIAGALVIVAVMGYGIKLAAFPPAEAAVQRYFDALRARDLVGATERLAEDLKLRSDASWSAMWSVLHDGRFQPPTGVRMGGWQHAGLDGAERVVAVQYELAGTTYSSLLKLRRDGGAWRITNGTGTVEVNVPGALVNGQSVGEGKRLKLLPGIYEVSTNPAAPLLTAPPVRAVVTPDRVGGTRLATTLRSDALANVSKHLGVIITACETAAGAKVTDCPFKSAATAGLTQVRWKLVSLPQVVVEQTGPESVRVVSVGLGVVTLLAVDANGAGFERVDSFSINGKCVEEFGAVGCTFTE
jgi:hypothetical protein